MRRLEWIGLQSLLAHPVVSLALLTHRYPPQWETVIRRAAGLRNPRLDGITVRIFEPRYVPGLSKSYAFGPEVYALEVTDTDAEILMAAAPKQFADVTDGHQPRRLLGFPDADIEPITDEQFRNFEDFTNMRAWLHDPVRR